MPEGPLGAFRWTNLGPLSRSTKEEIRENWDKCPDEGKAREICDSIKLHSIAILEGQDFFARCDDIQDINGGYCGRVARQVAEDVSGVRILQAGAGDHFWIEYDGKHYDAEVPTGVDDPFKLPLFARVSPEVMLHNVRQAAKREGREPPENLDDMVRDVTDEMLSD